MLARLAEPSKFCTNEIRGDQIGTRRRFQTNPSEIPEMTLRLEIKPAPINFYC